jgi:rSAM/selenodomain-associated transferase 1
MPRDTVEEAAILFARSPLRGQVKSRLQPHLTPDDSLALHRALVADAAALLRETAGRCTLSLEVRLSGPLPTGDPMASDLAGLEMGTQQGDDLGERLVHAFQDRLHRGARRVVIIGSDSPTMTPEYLLGAFQVLRDQDMVVGPAEDGGYVLIGCSRLRIRPFQGIDWGSDRVMAQTRKKLRRLKIPHQLLPTGHDLDTREDLLRTHAALLHLEQLGVQRAPRTLGCLRGLLLHADW